MTTAVERKIVMGLWAILLGYIAWSSIQLNGNTTTLAVISERVTAVVSRLDKLETLQGRLATVEAGCRERYQTVWNEIHKLNQHIATDTVWGKRIEERMADLQQRIEKLPPDYLLQRVKALEEWRESERK